VNGKAEAGFTLSLQGGQHNSHLEQVLADFLSDCLFDMASTFLIELISVYRRVDSYLGQYIMLQVRIHGLVDILIAMCEGCYVCERATCQNKIVAALSRSICDSGKKTVSCATLDVVGIATYSRGTL
jgi:hypothetical protein